MQPSLLEQLRGGRPVWLLCFAAALAACSPEVQNDAGLGPVDEQNHGHLLEAGVLDAGTAPTAEQPPTQAGAGLPAFCARYGVDDTVRTLFCDKNAPAVTSIGELEQRLGLDPLAPNASTYYDSMDAGPPARRELPADGGVLINLNVAVLGHSTALAGNLVSPINPRIILISNLTLLAFQRGAQRVEIATRAGIGGGLNFYLLRFRQACNDTPLGCTPGDLFTPRIESDWRSVVVEDDETLKNTSEDCRQCHQREGRGKSLLMRELNGPWTHFFAQDLDGEPEVLFPELGQDLVRDYRRAKGDESYAAISVSVLRGTIGLGLEHNVGYDQPLIFDATTILNERWPQGPDGILPGGPRRSPTWDSLYEGFKRGEHLPLPYFASRATDPGKQAALSEAYQRYRAGLLDAAALPDLADIYPDDPQTRAEIGLQTEPSATPAQALIQACGSCHNDVLDQEISRARFSIDLSRMDRAERELAVTRIEAAATSALVMPPPQTRQLAEGTRDRLIAYLRSDTRPAEDDALLARAASLGMAVVTKPDLLPN